MKQKMDKSKIDWPKKIKTLRRCFGLSQSRLSMRIGVAEKTIRRWEKAVAIPSRLSLLRIRKMFGRAWKEILERA